MALIYVGTVVSIDDKNDGGRIKARILPVDSTVSDENIPYAFPLLPKTLHIMPKVGEAVCIICQVEERPSGQRFYIGPIISQPQFMYNEDALSSGALLNGGVKSPDIAPSTIPEANGAYPKKDEIAICGRKNSDIILSDDDIRIRCGVHLTNEHDKTNVSFNKGEPAYIKLKYYPEEISENEKVSYGNNLAKEINAQDVNNIIDKILYNTKSTANIVADKINLISPNGSPYINTNDEDEGISDKDMIKFIKSAHELPYGDKLVEFLSLFLKMFKSHTHKYHNMPPCPDTESGKFDIAYGTSVQDLSEKLLSKDIRIN